MQLVCYKLNDNSVSACKLCVRVCLRFISQRRIVLLSLPFCLWLYILRSISKDVQYRENRIRTNMFVCVLIIIQSFMYKYQYLAVLAKNHILVLPNVFKILIILFMRAHPPVTVGLFTRVVTIKFKGNNFFVFFSFYCF